MKNSTNKVITEESEAAKVKVSEEEINQVYQGSFMREGKGFFDILFFNYAKPLLDSALTQQIRFEQYGDLPDRLLIKTEEEKIEASIQKYIAKNP